MSASTPSPRVNVNVSSPQTRQLAGPGGVRVTLLSLFVLVTLVTLFYVFHGVSLTHSADGLGVVASSPGGTPGSVLSSRRSAAVLSRLRRAAITSQGQSAQSASHDVEDPVRAARFYAEAVRSAALSPDDAYKQLLRDTRLSPQALKDVLHHDVRDAESFMAYVANTLTPDEDLPAPPPPPSPPPPPPIEEEEDEGEAPGYRKIAQKNKGKLPELSSELAHAVAVDGTVLVTWCNHHFSDFASNWVKHVVHDLKLTNYLVGSMDDEMDNVLLTSGYQGFHLGGGLGTGDFGWGSPKFHQMGRLKIWLAKTFVDFGVDLFLCDIDTVWMRNPLPFLMNYPHADILVSSDLLRPSATDGGLELSTELHSAMNIGVMYFRHGVGTRALLKAWDDAIQADDKYWDQNAFNDLVKKGHTFWDAELEQRWSRDRDAANLHAVNGFDRVFYGFDKQVTVGILPVSLFCSGHTFFVSRKPNMLSTGERPYIVHTTFQFAGTPGKRYRLREMGLWHTADDTAYFSIPEGGLLSFNMTLPGNVGGTGGLDAVGRYGYVGKGSAVKDGRQGGVCTDADDFCRATETDDLLPIHMSAVGYQLAVLADALALARAMGRVLVLPNFFCFCDRFWAPVEQCRIPGQLHLDLPFVCPTDHVLEAGLVGAKRLFDPSWSRERGYLLDDRLSTHGWSRVEVRSSGASAQASDVSHEAVGVGASGTPPLTVPRGSPASAWAASVRDGGGEGAPLVHVGPLVPGDVGADKFAEEARSAVDEATGGWCCTSSGGKRYNMLSS